MGITFSPNAGSAAMTLFSSGNLGLGTTTDNGQRLQVNGQVYSFKDNGYSYILDRTATTNYNGISYRTSNSAKWFIGMRENGSNDYIAYSEVAAIDAFRLNNATGAATFSSGVSVGSDMQINSNAGYGWLSQNGARVWAVQNGLFQINAATTYFNGGNVGIGTTSPDAQLVINGSSNSRFNMRAGDTRYGTLYADAGIFAMASITSIPLVFGINDVEKMRITSGGNVLIGTTTDATGKLQVNGTVYATGFYESSDIRLKTILEKNPIVDLKGIEVIKFTRNDSDINQVRYGYSAQEVQSICSDLVSGNDFLNVNYIDVHTLKIAALEQEIKELKTLLNEK